MEVDVIVGADGANSRVAKEIDAGDYEYAIAFQERMRIDEEKMDYYKVQGNDPIGDLALLGKTVSNLVYHNTREPEKMRELA